jgi:hypothetical protein
MFNYYKKLLISTLRSEFAAAGGPEGWNVDVADGISEADNFIEALKIALENDNISKEEALALIDRLESDKDKTVRYTKSQVSKLINDLWVAWDVKNSWIDKNVLESAIRERAHSSGEVQTSIPKKQKVETEVTAIDPAAVEKIRKARVNGLITRYRNNEALKANSEVKQLFDTTIIVQAPSTKEEMDAFEKAMNTVIAVNEGKEAAAKETAAKETAAKETAAKETAAREARAAAERETANTNNNSTTSQLEVDLEPEPEVIKPTIEANDEVLFNDKLKEALNPDTHIFLDLWDGQIFVMPWNKEIRDGILMLEDSLWDDKYAAYAMLKLISDNQDSIKTVSQVYQESTKGLGWTQSVISYWKANDKALLDAAIWNSIKTIEIDKWSAWGNILSNVATLGFASIDTANVTALNIKDDSAWRQASSTDFFKGYTRTVWNSNNKRKIEKIKPLKSSEKEAYLKKLAEKIEDVLDDRQISDGELETAEGSIAKKYLENAWFDEGAFKRMRSWAVELNSSFIQDHKIVKFLNDNSDSILPSETWVSISKDWFIQFNSDVLAWEDAIIKIELAWVWKGSETKEVFMQKTTVPFSTLGIDWSILNGLPNSLEPIVLEKSGMFMQVTQNGVTIIWESVADWYDSVADFAERNDVIVASVLSSLITYTLLEGGISLGSWSMESITNEVARTSDKIWAEGQRFLDKLGIKLWKWFNTWVMVGYLVAAIPLQYKIEWLKTELAQNKAQFKWGKAIDAEIDWTNWVEIDLNTFNILINIDNGEWKNKVIHQAIVKEGLFKFWEATWMDFSNVKKTESWYETVVYWVGDKAESSFVINWEKYSLERWETMTITLDQTMWKPQVNINWKSKKTLDQLRAENV